ncbi:MAG: gamma-glutamyltransferase family protein [Gammaproteobacteria bacterium]|nr:gamma-glutamyltransferase family protein [Gammaproteobacteria bacterium]
MISDLAALSTPARVPVVARNGMVATSQPLATQAGIAALRGGGSAVDAAITANAVLAVTEPHMCGPGGDLFALVWDPVARSLAGLNASGRSPYGLSHAALVAGLGSRRSIPTRGPWTLTTPGAVQGWHDLHARFGKLPWPALFAPAIDIARDGFALGVITAGWWRRASEEILREPELRHRNVAFQTAFMPNKAPPAAAQLVKNAGLARLFETLGEQGAVGFYRGGVARALLRAQQRSGGHLAQTDFDQVSADWVPPLTTDYRGYQVSVLPPNGQGLSVLQMLNLLEGFPLADYSPTDPTWWHLFIETKKLVFEDRTRYYADPAYAAIPITALLDKDYARARASLIDPRRASTDATPGSVRIPTGDTTYLTVADREGMQVSLIQSLFNPFGSGIVVPEYGFALQSRGAGFTLDPTHPNGYAPAKRPFHTIMPGFVCQHGAPWLSFGAVGGDMQPQAQVQVLVNLIDFGADLQRAGDLPRMRHAGGTQPNGLREATLGVAHYETGFAAATVAELIRRGHVMAPIRDPFTGFVGGYQGILRDPASGAYWGASESRLDGCALGY